ncbi:acetyl-CoA synthetase-like protein [Apiospora kogelbergensis]|uniref:acetyl-CoA synthetase-like protein n=1 Tax=Apiospora kogelbergensis TaxID=1337665 RepID=UPI00312D3E15
MSDNIGEFTPGFLQQYFHQVRSKSGYYRDLWKNVPSDVSDLEQLPVADNGDYWRASKRGDLMTADFNNGIILASGGTTSEPKTIYRTREEVQQAADDMGRIISEVTGMLPGDRIANLLSSGPMYGAFLGVAIACLYHMKTPQVHLPLTGQASLPQMANYIQKYDATVLLGNVFIVSRLADHLQQEGVTLPGIRLIMFLGESLHSEMRSSWEKAFPNMRAVPAMYSASDTGVLGIPIGTTDGSDSRPIYRVNNTTLVVELLDEAGNVIKEEGKKGRVIVTNPNVKLQPVIRYPVGDVARWTDYKRGHFEFLGREAAAFKLHGKLIEIPAVEETVAETLGDGFVGNFQILRRSHGGKEGVTLRFNQDLDDPIETAKKLELRLAAKVAAWQELLDNGHIHPLVVEKAAMEGFVYNPNSGKLIRYVDEVE